MPERFSCPKDGPPAELYRAKTALLNTRTARLALENEWKLLGHIVAVDAVSGQLLFSSSMSARNLGQSGAPSSSLGASGTKDDAIEIQGDEDSDGEGRPLGAASGVGAVSGATHEEDEEDETYAESEREDVAAGLTDELVSDCDVDDLRTSDWRHSAYAFGVEVSLYGVSEAELREELQQAVYRETFYMPSGDDSNGSNGSESDSDSDGEYLRSDLPEYLRGIRRFTEALMTTRIPEDVVRARVDERVRREEAWAAAQEEADDEEDEDEDEDEDDEVRARERERAHN